MYSVIQHGLTNVDPRAMLTVAGVQVVPLTCTISIRRRSMPSAALGPCIDTVILLRDRDRREPTLDDRDDRGFGISILAILSALLQLVQSRMMLPAADPTNDDPGSSARRCCSCRSSRSCTAASCGRTVHLLDRGHDLLDRAAVLDRRVGFDVPLFGWTPAFAVDHTPRFPGGDTAPEPSKRAAILTDAERRRTADKTIRRRERGRQGRRGRRR